MSSIERFDPAVISVYFLAVTVISMFCFDPIILLLSIVGGVGCYLLNVKKSGGRFHFYGVLIFSAVAIANPILSHKGATVLFFVNDTPITAESVAYGVVMGIAVLSTLYWFRTYTYIMTSDKLLYVFGKLSPKLSLILSMGLRYVELFSKQSKKIRSAQTALGFFNYDNIVDRIRGEIRVFSALVTWALENGIITADSMSARGYGVRKRTNFSHYSIKARDILLLVLVLLLFGVTVLFMILSGDFVFYPTLSPLYRDETSLWFYVFYGALISIPIFIEMEERIKWRYLRSKI